MKKSNQLKEAIKLCTMTTKRIKSVLEGRDLITDRKKINALDRAEKREQEEKNQNPVKRISFSIEWKKSYTWGFNPKLSATIQHFDGTYSHSQYTCSGCGYDKESTVIAQCFNDFMKYKLYRMAKTTKKVPYGINLPGEYTPRFSGGIGTSCYYDIAKFLGGEFKSVASGKTYDAFELIMKRK